MADSAFKREQRETHALFNRLYRRKWRATARKTIVATVICSICGRPTPITKWTRLIKVADGCSKQCRRLAGGKWPLYEIDGVKDTITGWAKRRGIDAETVRQRVRKGWSIERALSMPIVPRGQRRWPQAAPVSVST